MAQGENSIEQRLSTVIGGDWKQSAGSSGIDGVAAAFPQFRSQAIVGVLNDISGQIGARTQAVAVKPPSARYFSDQDPNAPRQVIVPSKLAAHEGFAEALDARVKQAINEQTSRLLSHSAQRGMLER